MANSLLSPTIIARTARVILENNLVMANKIFRDDRAFEAKIGATHTIRLPNRFKSNRGKTLNVSDAAEPSAVITINLQDHVDFFFDSDELTLTIEEFADRYLKPAMSQLANDVEAEIALLYKEIWNSVGTAGTTPSSYATSVELVRTRMDLMGVPQEGRCLVVEPNAWNKMATGMVALNYTNPVSLDALQKGYIPPIGGFEVYESQNIANHLNGTYTGTPLTEGAGAEGDLVTDSDGWTSTSLNKGDILTIGSVNAVNPQKRTTAGFLQDFVVGADITDTAGDIDFTHTPIINAGGSAVYQTVDALPADGATITPKGASATSFPQNLAFHRDAMALAMADLVLPQGVDFAARSRYKGIAVRIVRAYDVNNDSFPCRLDVLYGVRAIYPELAVRLWG